MVIKRFMALQPRLRGSFAILLLAVPASITIDSNPAWGLAGCCICTDCPAAAVVCQTIATAEPQCEALCSDMSCVGDTTFIGGEAPCPADPCSGPTATPTSSPTTTPTLTPTNTPTETPTSTPTQTPTESPTLTPTTSATLTPTLTPTTSATSTPTLSPTTSPTQTPTSTATQTPTLTPTLVGNGGPEICDNGIDDNGNGFIDCADVLCRDDPSCATPAPAMSPPSTALLAALLAAFGLLSLGWLQRRAQPAKP